MRGSLGGPRLLLRRLREVMAKPVSAQSRLDDIVTQIAFNMVAEVCSVYVLHTDGRLELYATEGLKREAVHLTTMRIDEGLVGLIAATAESLALPDAQVHPAFSYRPETGEEIYQSFLGVPILRGGNTLGVLVVQNRARRIYSEEEIEVLQTTAMLLAEMIASGELQSILPPGSDTVLHQSHALRGTSVADGVGLGHVVLHESRVIVKKLVAENVDKEAERLEEAVAALRDAIDRLVDRGDQVGPGEHREVLQTIRMFAHDRGWLRRLREAVMTGLTAEAAVERVQSDTRAKLQRQTDPYLRERLHDLDDLANRLLHQLTGQSLVTAHDEMPDNAVLVARSMGPAALLDYDRHRLRGLVLEDGGSTSHVAIVARALGVPVVGDVASVVNLVEPGDAIIVDGTTGEVHIRPTPEVEAAYAEKARLRARRQEQYRKLRDVPALSLDGVQVDLHMNAGVMLDLPHVAETNAASIGLFRTELLFMVASKFPRASQQYALYKSVMDAIPDRPVTFRTLDIGGDKILPYMPRLEEENPALGWRAIRIGLDRPALLRSQLRAMIKAGAGRELRVMFPMVATVAEFKAARTIALREQDWLCRHGHGVPSDLRLGVMVEVPSLLWQLDEIAEAADFLSVGSNDLGQYLFAVDRDNKRVATRFDMLSAPMLRALAAVAAVGAVKGKPVTLCGEMGGKPLEALALIALGYRGLSMAPSSIGPVKAMLLALDVDKASHHLKSLIQSGEDGPIIRERLRDFADEQAIPI
ncbi:phosphoenolpyruvate--protein phosphotransferase [Lichenifustis flavocetrariae]|uniref:phosphoenolpyruvate--protein phosphotransferase n=1 Tax=Lichenifustis flavocetrariae TaxID=2949735 RepID=A0AA42CQ51_9HYPH|nr:phosphoenolpyruvate--protein phosphotransferase [Lichenifustis flavocetrariae]MCW6511105.1 phosphoenolpyruvate--protein phosphotransferase [Lichenifustis flavocetrariae]